MDQLLPKLSHPPTTITEETKSNRNGRRDELVSLCYSHVDYARCSQLEERPQIWGCIFRAWETAVTEEHTYRCPGLGTLTLTVPQDSFTNGPPADDTTTDCLQQILEQFSKSFNKHMKSKAVGIPEVATWLGETAGDVRVNYGVSLTATREDAQTSHRPPWPIEASLLVCFHICPSCYRQWHGFMCAGSQQAARAKGRGRGGCAAAGRHSARLSSDRCQ